MTDSLEPTRPDHTRPQRSHLIRSFYFAFAGIAFLLRTQRNARIHVVVGLIASGLGWWLRISRVDWTITGLTSASVLILEGLNTAIEAAVDLASPAQHPLAKVAKDVAAGMVLIASIAAVIIGLIIFLPRLL
jgi:diacylglycerol kinase